MQILKSVSTHYITLSLINTYSPNLLDDSQVLLLNRLGDRLVVYCANSHISLYHLYTEENDKRKSSSHYMF